MSRSRSYHKRLLAVIALLAWCAVFCFGLPLFASTAAAAETVPQAGQPPSTANLLVNGRAITPAGTVSGPVGDMPLNIALSPDGKYAITTSSGLDGRLCSLRVSDGSVLKSLSYPTLDASRPNDGVFYGLVFDPNYNDNGYTFYAAQGAFGCVAVLNLGRDGTITQTRTIPAKPLVYEPLDQPGGLALANGNLYITNYFSVSLGPPHPPASTLSIYKTDGTFLGRYTLPDPTNTNTPCYPLAIAVKSDGKTAYVASQRDGCVYVLNTADPAKPVLAATIPNFCHPAALLLNRAQTRLFIANAGSDTISVVDTSTNRVISTVLLRPSNVADLPGVSPSGLALSPDEKALYASLGDFNAVAVIDTQTDQLSGYIPAGWYPAALAASTDGKGLLVVNSWGTTPMNPNPQFDYLNPDVLRVNIESRPLNYANRPGPGYVLNSIPGNVSHIDLTQALPALEPSSLQVIKNNQHTPAMGSAANETLARLGLRREGKIKHVIYIIKENRGYDQVLGDLPRGNGDPSLTLFGREITPNQHALAERFILLDNFYNNAPVSGEGWVWCTQSLANEFTVKNIPYVYQLALATYSINYAFEGQVNNYITCGYPARDQDGMWLSTTHQAAPAIPNVAEAPGGYIWDKVKAAGITYRNYGFFCSSGVPQAAPYLIPDNYPTAANLCPPGHIPTPPGQVAGATDYDFRRFDFSYADSDAWMKYGMNAADIGLTTGDPPGYYHSPGSTTRPMPSRFAEWNREFQAMLAQDPTGNSVPAFMTVRFMRDHTVGTNPTFASPGAMMADNDYAVGELVEAVSKSPIWKNTVIFVIEDDAQFSPDHVDTHRSFCLVISPWIKAGTLDSHFYDTNSVLKSMELLLGLTPMSQYDAFANPISGGWDTAPNNSARYDAILPPASIIGGVNPRIEAYEPNDPRRHLAELSSQMDWKNADAAPYQLLNQILWKSVKGPDSPAPEHHAGILDLLNKELGQESGDDGDGDQ